MQEKKKKNEIERQKLSGPFSIQPKLAPVLSTCITPWRYFYLHDYTRGGGKDMTQVATWLA